MTGGGRLFASTPEYRESAGCHDELEKRPTWWNNSTSFLLASHPSVLASYLAFASEPADRIERFEIGKQLVGKNKKKSWGNLMLGSWIFLERFS